MESNKQRLKRLRTQFRESVFKRDNYCCVICGEKHSIETADEFLDSHHVTDRHLMPNDGYTVYNGISLCKEKCHLMAEQFHISGGENWEIGFHPDDLYKKIDSSYEKAVQESEKLI